MQFAKLLERLGQVRKGRNFYSLRRTYRTIAAEVGKELAIDLTMGHADEDDDMAKVYTVGELRDELSKISRHVRRRLLGK
jgi:integrase